MQDVLTVAEIKQQRRIQIFLPIFDADQPLQGPVGMHCTRLVV